MKNQGLSFRSYYQINESEAYLGHKIGDILNGLQDLIQNADGMGQRQVTKSADQIVNLIRRILHTHWPEEQENQLKSLQKVGVAIKKAIEEKGDLPSIIQGAGSELEKVMEKLGMPINKLGSPEGGETPEVEAQGTGEPQAETPPQTPQTPPQAPPATGQPGLPIQPEVPGAVPGPAQPPLGTPPNLA